MSERGWIIVGLIGIANAFLGGVLSLIPAAHALAGWLFLGGVTVWAVTAFIVNLWYPE